jgi:hypothetical protein
MKKRIHTTEVHERIKLKPSYLLAIAVSSLIVLSLIVGSFRQSLFIKSRDRVNVLFYNRQVNLFSIGKDDNINYLVQFYPDIKVPVPGGYGIYRIGALGKMVLLEKKPELLKKTFAGVTSSFIDIYFYSGEDTIYYGDAKSVDKEMHVGFKDIFLSRSNANLFDRLFIYFLLSNKRQDQSTVIDEFPTETKENDTILSVDGFAKKYIGYFYRRTYREEKKNIQILYNSKYTSALHISSILEGSGIRVSDLTELDNPRKGSCEVAESGSGHSITATDLSQYFGCTLKKGDTGIYDIILTLGNLENDLEVR